LSADQGNSKDVSKTPVPWHALREFYLLDPSSPSAAQAARRFEAPLAAVRRRSSREGWCKLRKLFRKITAQEDPETWHQLLRHKALKALLSAELSSPAESIRLLELAVKVAREKKADGRKDRVQYVAEWGKGHAEQ